MKYYAIIVAGGSGNRMQTETPKQFLLLNNLPVLMHTIKAFHQNYYCPEIILVLAQNHLTLWQQLVIDHQFKIPHQIIQGGAERFYSVKNGLDFIQDEEAIVAVHDAVRPLTTQKTISLCFETATNNGNAIASVPSKDSIRRLSDGKSEALDRKEIYLVQTPQTFQIAQLRKAYRQEYDTLFTDDASVVENAGYAINLVAGDEFNFKITYKEDLKLAETILKIRS